MKDRGKGTPAQKALRKQVEERLESMRADQSEYMEDWRDCSDLILGLRPKFLLEQGANGKRERNTDLLNEVALWSANVLASGMMAGITSPARPWFQLETPDPDMMEYGPVKDWLSAVERRMLMVFARSNFYRVMNDTYFDLGIYGTAACAAYSNFDKVARFEHYEVGSYVIGLDGEKASNRLYREYSLSVGECVDKFGIDGVSSSTRALYLANSIADRVKIIHAMEPNDKRNAMSPLSMDKPERSVYYEKDDEGYIPLRQSGFNSRPFMTPRWHVIGSDTYSSLYPGMNTMGSNRALQVEELDKAIAIEKMHNPPLIADSSLQNNGVDLIAGGVTFSPNMTAMGKPGLQSVYDVNPRINELMMDINAKEERIKSGFFADLFLMISSMDRANITATEIVERKEEKLLMMGPVLERLNTELFDPIIDRTFDIAQSAGILPPPPKELENSDLGVTYISVLAQAQKAVSTSSMDVTAAFAMNLAAADPTAMDKIDTDQMIDEYAKAKGAPPKTIRSDEDVAAIREGRAAQQAQQEQQAQAMAAAQGAKTLSETPVGQDSALDAIMGS